MQKKFLGNLIFIIILNLLIKPFYVFGIDVQIQNMVGLQEYGIYFSLLSFSFLFNMFLDIGITNYNTHNTAQSPQTLQKYLGTFIGLKSALALIYIFITLGSALLIGYSGRALHFLVFFMLNQILAGFILYIRSNFAGLHYFKIDALLSVLDRLLLIIIASFFIYGGIAQQHFKIEWFIYMQTLAYGSALIVGLCITRFKIGKFKIQIHKIISLSLLRKSFPFALLILLMMLYTRIDSVMIERLLPNGNLQAGIYAQGFRLLDAVNTFAFLVAGLLFPIFSRLITQKLPVKPILQLSAKLLIGVACVVGIGLALNAQFVIDSIYTNQSYEAGQLFFWLILSFIPLAFSHIFSTLLTANKNLKLLNIMAICGIATNIGLNFLLIPILHAKGAAIATLITQSITALLQVIFVLRVFKFRLDWKNILRFALLLLLFLPFVLYIKTLYINIIGLLLVLITGGILLFLLQIIRIKDILSLLKPSTEES